MTTLGKVQKTVKRVGLGLAASLTAVSLFVSPMLALADAPNMALIHLGSNGGAWSNNVTVNSGESVWLYTEVHNTMTGTTANNVRIHVNLPSTSGNSTATVTADNANTATGNVSLTVNGGQLQYVPGSTHMTWDSNGDGTNDADNQQMPDGITTGNLLIGNMNGCYAYVAQITFEAKVTGVQPTPTPSPTPTPTPSPTPTPVPSPSPTPGTGGTVINNTNNNSQTQNQTNNQTVNVTTASAVAGVKVPVEQPKTGPEVLGLATMFGAAPLGVVLSRYGRGRLAISKREEDLSSVANDLVKTRAKRA